MNKVMRLLVVITAAWSATPSVHAYTVDEIVGSGTYKDAADETYFSKADCYSYPEAPLGHSSHIRLSKVIEDDRLGIYSTTKIKVEGFTGFSGGIGLDGFMKADFTFVLADENGYPDADGEYLYLENDLYRGIKNGSYYVDGPNASTDGKYYIIGGYEQDMSDYGYDFYYTFGKKGSYLSTFYDWKGKISMTDDGEYRIEFSNPAIMSSANNAPATWISAWTSNTIHIIDHYAIETFTPNATFKCKVAPFTYNADDRGVYGTPVEKEFQVKYTIDGNGNFKVLNLLGEGFAITNGVQSMSDPALYTGKYNSETGVATLDGGQVGWLKTVNKSYNNARVVWHFGSLTTVRVDNSLFDSDFKDVVVKNDNTEGSEIEHLYHFKPTSHWVSNGGLCRTFISSGESMKIHPFAFVCYDSQYKLYDSSPAYTDGEFDAHQDVTLGLAHECTLLGMDGTNLYVETAMQVEKNDMYVDSYELWMAPRGTAGMDVNSGAFLHENGHEDGWMLDAVHVSAMNGKGAPSRVAGRAAGASHRFKVWKPISAIINADKNDKYIFYIKANYRPETGLSPTIHGLTEPVEITTGVDAVKWNDGAKAIVKAVDGGIEVKGAEGVVDVFTPGGVRVYRGADERIALERGLYVVRVDGVACKVVVR